MRKAPHPYEETITKSATMSICNANVRLLDLLARAPRRLPLFLLVHIALGTFRGGLQVEVDALRGNPQVWTVYIVRGAPAHQVRTVRIRAKARDPMSLTIASLLTWPFARSHVARGATGNVPYGAPKCASEARNAACGQSLHRPPSDRA